MSRKPKSPGGETDMRIGVSKVEHELLDGMAFYRDGEITDTSMLSLESAMQALRGAFRAKPEEGKARYRRSQALQAACLLVLAVEQMDDGA